MSQLTARDNKDALKANDKENPTQIFQEDEQPLLALCDAFLGNSRLREVNKRKDYLWLNRLRF